MKGSLSGGYLAAVLLAASLCSDAVGVGQESTADCPLADRPPANVSLGAAILDLLGDRAEHYGLVVVEPAGAGLQLQPERVFYAASLYKVAVMYELFRQRDAGAVGFDEELIISAEDAAEDLGTLDLLGFGEGDAVKVGHLLEFMITVSDNTSAVVLERRLGGENVDRTLQALGLWSTSVTTPDLPTTAGDIALLLSAIAEGGDISDSARQEMAELLRRQTVREWIPAGLPEDVTVGNKTGSWTDAAHDAAIVWAPFGTYILVILSDTPEESGTIAELSRIVYEYLASEAVSRPAALLSQDPVGADC